MTREETKKCIEIMQAYVDGAEIEGRNKCENKWLPATSPSWDWIVFDYRKKTQPTKVTEEEKILLKMIGKIVKTKDTGYISLVTGGNPEALKSNFYFLNIETQEWEDWSEK